jgi:uncharacterized protein YgiB involved in biofilm formation
MTHERTRRRSRAVDLAILGAAGGMMTALGGCSKATYERNVYASMADCAADYSMATCSGKGSQGAGFFLGPIFRLEAGRPSRCDSSDPGAGPPVGSRKLRTETVQRGGFGTGCRSSSRSRYRSSSRSYWGG